MYFFLIDLSSESYSSTLKYFPYVFCFKHVFQKCVSKFSVKFLLFSVCFYFYCFLLYCFVLFSLRNSGYFQSVDGSASEK